MASSENNKDNLQEEDQKPSIFARIENHFQRRVLSGLFELVPLIVTIVVILYLVGVTDGFVRGLPFVKDRPWDFPGIGLIVMVVIFYIVGLLGMFRAGQKFLDILSTILRNLPLVRSIYGVTRQAMSSVSSSANFSRVVFIEWPRDGMVAMGFVTGRARAPGMEEDLVSVYIPTVPNPTSGNMAFVLEDDIVETDVTVEDAMKLIFSGGIVLPEDISMARMPREMRNQTSFIGRYYRT